jgi:hypothetical protein
MKPVDTARVMTQERHRQPPREVERRQLIAVLSGRPVVSAPAYKPSAT